MFVLVDGRRFSCAGAAFAQSTPTPGALARAPACAPRPRLRIPAATRAMFTAIGAARTCLTSRGLGVTGGPMFPPDPGRPTGPDGELIVGDGTGAAFVAFYRDLSRARRLESSVVANARRFGGQTERHGAVTIVWVHAPPSRLRTSVRSCARA